MEQLIQITQNIQNQLISTNQIPAWLRTKKGALLASIVLNVVVMCIEFVVGNLANSLLLISDGFHMMSHAGSLLVSLLGFLLHESSIELKWRKKTIPFEHIAAAINAYSLLVFSGFIIWESYLKFIDAQAVNLGITLIIALLGLLVNLATALLLSFAGLEDLNSKSAFMHLLADTFSSIAVLGGTLIMAYTSWYEIDAILSLIIALVIIKWAIDLLRAIHLGKELEH